MKTQTQTKTQNNHAQNNQDKAGHYDKAVIALNIKYFQVVHGLSRDEAKTKVDTIIAKGDKLMTAIECNQAIARASKDKQREEEARAQAEFKAKKAAEDARKAEEMKAKADKEKAEKDKVKDEHAQFVENMIANGNSVVQIKGYLLFCGYTAKQIKAYLESLDLSSAKKRTERDTFNTRLYNRLYEGPMTEAELDAMIGDDKNAIKNKGSHMRKMNLANRLHEKYAGKGE